MNRAALWLKYKTAFLKANRCTDWEFEQAYCAFMLTKPDIDAYRQFAKTWGITIHSESGLPVDVAIRLSVDVAAIKVMAVDYLEAEAAVNNILSTLGMQ